MRRLHRADADERARVVCSVTSVLETEPDVVYAWLHGSFLDGRGFHGVDVAVRLAAPPARRLDLP